MKPVTLDIPAKMAIFDRDCTEWLEKHVAIELKRYPDISEATAYTIRKGELMRASVVDSRENEPQAIRAAVRELESAIEFAIEREGDEHEAAITRQYVDHIENGGR